MLHIHCADVLIYVCHVFDMSYGNIPSDYVYVTYPLCCTLKFNLNFICLIFCMSFTEIS